MKRKIFRHVFGEHNEVRENSNRTGSTGICLRQFDHFHHKQGLRLPNNVVAAIVELNSSANIFVREREAAKHRRNPVQRKNARALPLGAVIRDVFAAMILPDISNLELSNFLPGGNRLRGLIS